MPHSIILFGREVTVEISRRAEKALQRRDKPVVAVVHLIFGCMLAKRVWFRDPVEVADEVVPVTDRLGLAFNVVRYAICSLKLIDGGAEPEDFPLALDKGRFVPDCVHIDYRKHEFTGAFSYSAARGQVQESLVDPALETGRGAL
ncbi:MAG TPA: hypothetical protein ENK49_01695 [Gammaproteobacteria bacterium]|nr:hypothetical protein [Gammaproteobacteria bacterium]